MDTERPAADDQTEAREPLDFPLGADREPTPEEERVAEEQEPVAESVAEHYEEMIERGAKVEGEGKV